MTARESTSTGIDNDKIAVQEAKPAQINDLGALHYLSPEVASTVLWSAARLRKGNAEVVSAHVDLRTATHFAERERIRRCEAEEVRGRRAQLRELRQKLDSHAAARDAMRRQLLEKIAHGVELVGLRCAEQMSREAAEAVRAQLAAVSAAVAAHCRQSDVAEEAHLRWRESTTLSLVKREERLLQLQQQEVFLCSAHVTATTKRRARVVARLLHGLVLWLARTRLNKAARVPARTLLGGLVQSQPNPNPTPDANPDSKPSPNAKPNLTQARRRLSDAATNSRQLQSSIAELAPFRAP